MSVRRPLPSCCSAGAAGRGRARRGRGGLAVARPGAGRRRARRGARRLHRRGDRPRGARADARGSAVEAAVRAAAWTAGVMLVVAGVSHRRGRGGGRRRWSRRGARRRASSAWAPASRTTSGGDRPPAAARSARRPRLPSAGRRRTGDGLLPPVAHADHPRAGRGVAAHDGGPGRPADPGRPRRAGRAARGGARRARAARPRRVRAAGWPPARPGAAIRPTTCAADRRTAGRWRTPTRPERGGGADESCRRCPYPCPGTGSRVPPPWRNW